MNINFAHLRDQGINFVVFDADAPSRLNSDRASLLSDLTARVVRSSLRVEKSALAYKQGSRIHYYGTPDLVRYLAKGWLPHWTHSINV